MRFAYTRRGGPLLDWNGVTPPSPTRAGETRSLGDFYPTNRSSGALRRYGGPGAPKGAAVGYEHNRALGYWGAQVAGHGGAGYHPVPGMGDNLYVPLPGAPEVVEGYESPAPGAAVIHLGAGYPWDQKYPGMSGYMPEGAARGYGQTMIADVAPAKPQFDMSIVRKVSAVASAYHGVKRNGGSVFWGILWGIAGYAAPFYGLLMPAIAIAQGYARPPGPGPLISNPFPNLNPFTTKKRKGKGLRKRSRRRTSARKRYVKARRRFRGKVRATRRKTMKRRVSQRTKRWRTRRGY